VVLEHLATGGAQALTGGFPAFVNFAEALLLDDLARVLPPELVVVEVLEDVPPLEALAALKRDGYRIALDDVVSDERVGAFGDLPDYVKLDFMALPAHERSAVASAIRRHGSSSLLAEKVETAAELEQARPIGASAFQGFFLDRPETTLQRGRAEFQPHHLELMNAAFAHVIDFGELERIIKPDVSLSERLLRIGNSALLGQMERIDSIRRVLVLLGEQQIQRITTLLVLSGVGASRPSQLTIDSAVRARFSEHLVQVLPGRRPLDLYLVGLLSKLDALTGLPMPTALEGLPIADGVVAALTERSGPLASTLALVEAYERADWNSCDRLLTRADQRQAAAGAYLEAVRWATGEVVPSLVELEVAVPHLSPAVW
jgi:EAL and modified HD-GYP domain-containing signal transduction protein